MLCSNMWRFVISDLLDETYELITCPYKALVFFLLCRRLYVDGLLPTDTKFVGYARSKLTVEDIKAKCSSFMKVGV